MANLRVILDSVVTPSLNGISRYAEELTRQLIATAPRGSTVSGIVPASPEPDYERLAQVLPGLRDLSKSPLARRQLAAAWQHGFTLLPGTGIVHAPTLLAPLHNHGPAGQTVVTIHDAIAWTHPEIISSRETSWHRAMAKRAERYADAVVVPTHAVAEELGDFVDFGDRLRVIGGAASLVGPTAHDLELPDRFLLTTIGATSASGLEPLLAAMDLPALRGWELHVVAPAGTIIPAGERIRPWIDPEADIERELFQRATVFVLASDAEGFGLPLLDAMASGTPVVHSDVPALIEVAGDAGLIVERSPADGYPDRLAEAIAGVLGDPLLADQLVVAGTDRSRAFSWRDSAEKVWQLHADL